jgi:hypothetical protein
MPAKHAPGPMIVYEVSDLPALTTPALRGLLQIAMGRDTCAAGLVTTAELTREELLEDLTYLALLEEVN